jgi:hypothetical protein
MRYRRYVSDAGNDQPGTLKGADGRFPPGAGAFDKNVNLAQAHVHTPASGLFGGPLGGEGGSFTGTFESHSAGAGGGNYIALRVRNANGSVVESGIDVRPAVGDNATFSAA